MEVDDPVLGETLPDRDLWRGRRPPAAECEVFVVWPIRRLAPGRATVRERKRKREPKAPYVITRHRAGPVASGLV